MNSHDSLLTDKAASSKLSKFEGEGFSSYTASFFYKQCLKRLRVLFLLVSNYKLNTRVAVRHAKLTSQPSLYFTWNVKRQTDVCDAKSLLWYVQQPEVELVVIQAEWQQAGIYTRKPIWYVSKQGWLQFGFYSDTWSLGKQLEEGLYRGGQFRANFYPIRAKRKSESINHFTVKCSAT